MVLDCVAIIGIEAMTMRAVGLGALGVSSLALLGGCTTMQGSQR